MSKTRRGRGGVNQGNHNTRYTNRGRGYRGTSGGHHNNNNYREQSTKAEGIYHNHCILAALSHLLGQTVHVRSKNDSVYEGIFTTISPRASFVLKCVHKIDKKQVNGFTGDLSQPLPHKDSVRREIVFEFDDIISVAGKIEKIAPPVQKGPEGFIDSEVSKRRGRGNERKELQRWTDNSMSENLDNLSLDTDTGNGGWTYEDMIRTNEEKFNVSSMYDENMDEYTTPIPAFDEEVRKKAALLAEEIESRSTSNVHVAEERGQIVPIDVSEEDRYSAVVRPGLDQEFIEIQTNNKGRYTTDIPAPLSQVDEPTEELFKEEKEALKKQKETLDTPPAPPETKKPPESEGAKKPDPEPLKKCVAIETQTEPNCPKHHKKSTSALALSPMPKVANSPKSSPTVASPQIQTDPTPKTETTAAATTTAILNNETTPKSPNVQHTATQAITQKRDKVEEVWKKEENVQKKIMKSERSYQSHRKGDHKEEMSGLMNFKTKYEDSTQYKTKSPVTIAQSTAAPSQIIQPTSQQPVAVPQMITKQRNDSMSSVGESSNHGGHASQYQRPSVQGIQILQHQQQQQQQMMHIQMQQQMQHQMQLQQHMAQAQHQQAGHQQVLAVQHNMQAIQMQQMVAFQQQRQQQHQMHQQHHQQIQHQQQVQQLQIDNNKFNLNPDAMEFKPGSGPPTPTQYTDKNNSMVVMPGQAVAVIPAQVRQPDMAVMQQNNIQGGALIGQYGHPSLVLYPSNPLLSRGYIPAVSMPMQPNHNAHNQMVPEQSQQPTGIMSPTSPTPAGPQLIYHHNPQIVSQPQYQSQIHPQMVHAAAASQFLQLQSQNGPYANPLQPHSGHGGAVMNTLFPYAHPPNVG